MRQRTGLTHKPNQEIPTRWIAGCMTGTSLDGLDAVLTHIRGAGLDLEARFAGLIHRPLGDLAAVLQCVADGNAMAPIEYLRAARELGQLHAEAVRELLRRHLPGKDRLDFAVVHGQTIWHAPREHLSWQLIDPQPLVRRLKVPVCFDLRQADLIAGGQGAPITPLADQILFRHQADLVVNLGGICNLTRLSGQLDGFDLCPCNLLIDRVVQILIPDLRFDEGGKLAAAGRSDSQIFKPLFEALPFYQQRRETLGREDFPDEKIAAVMDPWLGRCSPEDLVASSVEAVAETVAGALARHGNGRVALAGGGARNPVLVECIRHHADPGVKIQLMDELGIPCEAREAVCIAVLGALCQDGLPITIPQITGSKDPGVAGTWVYP